MRMGDYTQGKAFLAYTHKTEWESCGGCGVLDEATLTLLKDSVVLLNAVVTEDDGQGGTVIVSPADDPPTEGTWEEVLPGAIVTTTLNGKIVIDNDSTTKTIWVNTDSLVVENVKGVVGGIYSLTDKISANVVVNVDDTISFTDVSSSLTVRDLSIPIERCLDTRITRDDVYVNQYHNFGVLIDGSVNPITGLLLQLNGSNRFDKQEGGFFNYVQPYQHHTNTPAVGIVVYSFAINPERHQPSGSANLSRIDNTQLILDVEDTSYKNGLPELGMYSSDNALYVFARSINVLRIISGMGGLAYAS
jgi:hypothetical protein